MDQQIRKKHKSSEGNSTPTETIHHLPYIPEELLRNILSSLPMRSLARFKCVSKQWNRCISGTRYHGNKKLLFATHWDGMCPRYNTAQTIDQNGLVEDPHIPLHKMSRGRSIDHYNVLGSCNGLLLISIETDLFLCNLTTHRFIRTMLSSPCLAHEGCDVVCGLCFDSCKNDYMVVMTMRHYDDDTVVVGSTRKKHWNNVYFPYDAGSITPGVTLGNRLHWCAREKRSHGDCPSDHIIFFDPKTHAFVDLPLPETKGGNGISIGSVGVLRGCLCMTRHRNIQGFQCDVEVLRMKEYGVKESWSLLFKLRGVDNYRGLMPYFYTRNKHEVVMRVSMAPKECVVWYDTKRQIYTQIKVPVDLCTMNIVYEETLVDPLSYGREDRRKYRDRRR